MIARIEAKISRDIVSASPTWRTIRFSHFTYELLPLILILTLLPQSSDFLTTHSFVFSSLRRLKLTLEIRDQDPHHVPRVPYSTNGQFPWVFDTPRVATNKQNNGIKTTINNTSGIHSTLTNAACSPHRSKMYLFAPRLHNQ
jgi:hypothetical protein